MTEPMMTTSSTTCNTDGPTKVVSYVIANETEGGALFLYGDPNASNIIICCAGYPDDHSIMQPFALRLAREGSYFLGVMCLPGFDDTPEKPWTSHKKEGYTFDEMTGAIREAVKVLRAESTFEGAKLTGIFHDWGVYPGSIWAKRAMEEKNPEAKPDQLVLFDVLPPPNRATSDVPKAPKPTLYEIIVSLTYRMVLAISFLLQLYLSKLLAGCTVIVGFTIIKVCRLDPTYDIDTVIVRKHKKDLSRMIYMGYPYRNFFQVLFSGNYKDFVLPKDLSETPVLYMYGTKKRIHFHDQRSLKILEREEKEGRSKSKAVAVKNAGHWFYVQRADLCIEAVKSYIAED